MLIKKFTRHDHVDALDMVIMVMMTVMVMVIMMIVMIMVMMRVIIEMVMITRVTLRRLRRCSCGALVTVCRARLRRQLLDIRKICSIFVPFLISKTRL